MDILEHPLEAVAFRLYSLPVPDVSAATSAAAWTCLAAVLAAAAAAAGLWRLRNSVHADAGTDAVKHPLQLEPPNAMVVSPETASASARSPDSAALMPASPSLKERYTAYYRDCGRVGCCDVDDEEGYNEEEEKAEEQDEDDDSSGAHRTPEPPTTCPLGWEVVRSLPLSPITSAAETGRYRSPTPALSGSVVRLWDEAFDAGVTAASPRRRSSRVLVGTVVSAF